GMTGGADLSESAERAFRAFASRLSAAPVAIPQMLSACEWVLGQPREIILVGELGSAELAALVRVLRSRFLPSRVVLLVDSPETGRAFSGGIPSIETMRGIPGRASAYVCRDYTCQLPVSEPASFAELLQY